MLLSLLALFVGIDIVDQGDVDTVHAETLEAFFHRPHYPFVTVAVDDLKRQRGGAGFDFRLPWVQRFERSPDLGREHETVAPITPKVAAHPVFAEAVSIERCYIEVADAGPMGGGNGIAGLILRDRLVEVANRGPAKTEHSEGEGRPSQRPPLKRVHPWGLLGEPAEPHGVS